MPRWRAGALTVTLAACAPTAPPPEPATLVLMNGRVVTVDDTKPEAQAVAVRGETIVAVGTTAEIATFVGRETASSLIAAARARDRASMDAAALDAETRTVIELANQEAVSKGIHERHLERHRHAGRGHESDSELPCRCHPEGLGRQRAQSAGKLADIVILLKDIMTIPEDVAARRIVMSWPT